MKKLETVKENVSFRRAYHQGKNIVTPEMVVYWRRNRLGKTRLGITVSKKIGNSPQRNRARRIIREAVWKHTDLLPAGCDIIVVARSRILQAKSTDLEQIIQHCFPV